MSKSRDNIFQRKPKISAITEAIHDTHNDILNNETWTLCNREGLYNKK